jgi:hypothetical protein
MGAASNTMIGSAQRLANWLRIHPFPGCARSRSVGGTGWETNLRGSTGVVFFKDYWRRRGETQGVGSGDHIDLWNRNTLTPSIQSFLRFTIGVSSLPDLNPFSDAENWFSDLARSSQILFWSVA